MTTETGERPSLRPTLTLESVSLRVGHEIGLYVDSLGIDPSKVDVSLQLKPTSENPDANNLLISGTDTQLDAFEKALDLSQQAVIDSAYHTRLRSALITDSLFSRNRKYF